MIVNLDNRDIVITILLDTQPYLFWSEGIQIVFCLNGTAQILMNGETTALQQAGLLLINPMELCQISCDNGSRAIALHIPKECLRIVDWPSANGRVHCLADSQWAQPQTVFDELRKRMAKVVLQYLNQEPQRNVYQSLLRLLEFVHGKFPMQINDMRNYVSQSSITRLNQVLQFIHQHWNENLTIPQIAAHVYVSPNYLSRFFHKHLHVTVMQYVSSLRMKAALAELSDNQDSITEIAMRTGFPSVTAFITKFKQTYGLTPKQYRKTTGDRESCSRYSFDKEDDTNDLSALFEYDMPFTEQEEPDDICRSLEVTLSAKTRPLRHTWRKLLNFGYARDGLLASVQQQICRAQRDIGFEYVRFHGIFDDSMQFYHEDSAGNIRLNFLHIDLLLDFLIEQGFKLYIEFGLMPEALKKYDIFIHHEGNYSVAADPYKWRTVIMRSVQHWIARYGRETVRTWRFVTFGIHVPVFTVVTFEEFYQHYQISYQAVKDVDAALQFGGPGGFASLMWEESFFSDFLRFAQENHCFPDFICTQNYPHSNMASQQDFLDAYIEQNFLPVTLSGDRHFTKHLLQRIRHVLDRFGEGDRPIWMEEWNSTIWRRDLSSDTCYKSAWLAKEIAENYDDVEAFGYWLLTDLIGESDSIDGIFLGEYGLFTYNGVPKSSWQTLCLLRKMTGDLLAQGEWYLITRSEQQIHLLLFHYCAYSSLYRYRYRRLERPDEAYHVFEQAGKLEARLTLHGLPNRSQRMQRFHIGREQGSCFDRWLQWGAPHEISLEDIRQLHLATEPEYHLEHISPDEQGDYTVQAALKPHEIELLVIDLY